MVLLKLLAVLACVCVVKCELVRLSCAQIRQFVDGHNSRRLQVARGEVPGQPAAAEMKMILWDEELAQKAANWASYEMYGHNPDSTIPSQRFTTGENIFWKGNTDPNAGLDINNVLDVWFNEYRDFGFHQLSNYDFSGRRDVGHYTQMAWSNSIYLGCAISRYYGNNWYNYFVVCNYGPAGNIIGQYPYRTGYAAGRLSCGVRDCSRQYGSGC